MATIEQRMYDGTRAKEILDNEVFQSVFADIEQELFQAWIKSPVRDVEGRERLHQYQSLLTKLKEQLTSTFETGRLAALELEHKQTMFDQARAWLRNES